MTGIGNPKRSSKELNLIVFIKISIKLGDVKKFVKCLNPTHSLPDIPRIGLKSLKAIDAPYIGRYLNMIVRITAGAISKYRI
jgi:hypothetical protein